MENNRAIKVMAALVLIFVLLIPANALAYNNVGVHPRINEYAFDQFESTWMKNDQYLKQASLDGRSVYGEAWDPSDGTTWTDKVGNGIISVKRSKSMEQWVIDGGFSADEPEADMAMVHFYDPVRSPHYLTDQLNDIPGGKYVNPQISAYEWAFGNSPYKYNFLMARKYYRDALSSTDPDNINYGNAWRAVGETMHLMSDMTVPAHVRNDGHVPFRDYVDPYEYFTTVSHIDKYRSSVASSSVGPYKRTYPGQGDIQSLMHDVAYWTNTNFFSRDTIPLYGKTITANDEPAYPSPKLTISPTFTGYYNGTVDGKTVPMARQSLKGWIWKTPAVTVDQTICDAQREILIPVAIKSSAAVLDAFLPRFEVKIDEVTPEPEKANMRKVEGSIKLIPTSVWPKQDELVIRNGAYLTVTNKTTGKSSTVPIVSKGGQALNNIEMTVEAYPGDSIQLLYDLGGYVVYSNPYRLPVPSVTPTPVPTEEPDTGSRIVHVRVYDSEGKIFSEETYLYEDGLFVKHGLEAMYMWYYDELATQAKKEWDHGTLIQGTEKILEWEGASNIYPYRIENNPKPRFNPDDNSVILRLGSDEMPKNLPSWLK
ncbi:hypothetical protein CUJ83_10665 [Methanocella sp. CWC-04]|uniref:Zinc dependent phospholipase C n=1 Tax=Methanooceanicella nereidis TaxID=2052831 RepID=A0AAP2RES1_9EURY|nr:hypothetical protein [Methanocella sp. CWC-04]MCD1295461.1 hypothetical protein [Methanocella sp. CWC-04]